MKNVLRYLDNSLESFGKPEILEDMELPEVLMRIKSYVNIQKFNAAFKLILRGKETYKDEPLLKYVLSIYVYIKSFYKTFY